MTGVQTCALPIWAVVHAITVEFQGGEGDVAKPLGEIQDRFSNVTIGSYPFESSSGFATNLVLRSRDKIVLEAAAKDVEALAAALHSQGKARGWKRL